MRDINDVLNDESHNDKELVKELSIYVKNHKDKKLPINKQFIKDIIDITLRNSEIDFENVVFINFNDISGIWVDDSKTLIISSVGISKQSKLYKDYLHSRIGDNSILAYYTIIETIVHELTHARQYYVNATQRNDIYTSCNEIVHKKYKEYRENHDLVLTERYASLRGSTIAYEVLSYIYPQKQVKEFKNVVYGYLLAGYKVDYNGEITCAGLDYYLHDDSRIISALDSYNELIESISMPTINIESGDNMQLYDRFYLGLPITTKEYNMLRIMCNDMVEQSSSVKGLIRELQVKKQ